MTDIMPKILEFMKSAGNIASRNYDHTTDTNYKSDAIFDIVTESDIEISRLFRKFCADNFAAMDYVIIDEESVSELGDNPFAEIAKHEYQFVLDPIDGTLTYAQGIPMFGISVGVLRNGHPLTGAIYAPILKELVYGDLNSATWVKNAFSKNQTISPLHPGNTNKNAFLLNMDWFVKPNNGLDCKRDIPANFYSAVANLLYVATGRGRAFYFGALIWDLAGAWAFLRYLGFEFMNYKTEKVLSKLNSEDFGKDFRIKDCHIVCRPNDFPHLKEVADLTGRIN